MAYAALLAFHAALGASAPRRRLRDWILSFEDASGQFTKEDLRCCRYSATATTPRSRAGPGRPGDGLGRADRALHHRPHPCGCPCNRKEDQIRRRSHPRPESPRAAGISATPISKSYELEASMMSTALALAALGAAASPKTAPPSAPGSVFSDRACRRRQHGLSGMDPSRDENLSQRSGSGARHRDRLAGAPGG